MQAGRRRPQRAAAQRNSKPLTLQKYITRHKMETNIGASRQETVEAVSKHFMSQGPPTEEDAIAAFLLALKQKMAKDEKRASRPSTGRRAGPL